jgi:hypothetical protein
VLGAEGPNPPAQVLLVLAAVTQRRAAFPRSSAYQPVFYDTGPPAR